MKVAIITYHKVYNYGSSLQAYATKKAFEEFASCVEIINFVPERYKGYGSFKQIFNEKMFYTNNPIIGLLMTLKSIGIRKKQKKAFDKFDEYLQLGKEIDSIGLKQQDVDADIYVTGSDQVWNNFYGGFEKSFFLDFVPTGSNCFAYSASFGKSDFNVDERAELKKLLSKYKLISVRENTGKMFLDLLEISNIQLLDPVYYLKIDDWKTIMCKSNLWEGKKYILVYQLDSHGKLIEEAKKVRNKLTGADIIFIETENARRVHGVNYVTVPTVNEFLSLFFNAEYVITDSFHGTTFSICMHKNFSCVLPKRYSNRIESVLDIMGLQSRIIRADRDCNSIFQESIDWQHIENVLSVERDRMKEFINKCLDLSKQNIL